MTAGRTAAALCRLLIDADRLAAERAAVASALPPLAS